jgi:Fe2+ or Zn2+ uptake regulation protein
MAAKSRLTNQKIKILEYLRSTKSHPTAEKIFTEVRKSLPAISLTTVYRNLNDLAEKGKVLRMEVNKEYRYDCDTEPHEHCVCRICGKVIDNATCRRAKRALRTFKSNKFRAESVSIVYSGICKSCR